MVKPAEDCAHEGMKRGRGAEAVETAAGPTRHRAHTTGTVPRGTPNALVSGANGESWAA